MSRENVQVTAGIRINGPLVRRPKDRFGVGFVYSKISHPFRDCGGSLGEPLLGSEKAVEVNYTFQITPFWIVQPAFQYYANIGGNPAISNAPVLGFRTKVKF